MSNAGNGDIGPENREGDHMDCSSMENFTNLPSDKVLKMTVGSEALYKRWNGVNSPISGGWSPLDSVSPTVEAESSVIASHDRTDNSSSAAILQSQGTSSTTNVVHFQSYCSLAELESTIPCFGSRSFSEMDSFFSRQSCHQIGSLCSLADYYQQGSGGETAKVLNLRSKAGNFAQIQEECKIFDEPTMTPSSDGKKRKRDDSAQLKNMKTDQEKDQCLGKHDQKNWKPERKPAASIFHRLEGKQIKDNSITGDAAKEDWVHVRAKRGQATNSHSLAERVRREKIRDRMKFLQDLVPGCSKITGKAVMLDEIINYVLSLQRQVEFLSMKLTTVYPEMNVEPERILSRDIHHSQGGNAAILGDPGMSNYPKELLQGAYLTTQTSNLEPSIIPNVACIWGSELDNTGQMDFIPNLAPQNQDSNGVLK